jgi:hypothetical protein
MLRDGLLQEQRVPELVAAAAGELRLDQRGDRDDVGRRPVLRLDLQRRVLGRQLVGVLEVVLDAGVDARHVVLFVLDDLRAERAVLVRQGQPLLLQLRVGVAGQQEHVPVHRQVVAARPEELAELALPDVAERVHHEQPVGRGDPPGPPLGLGPRPGRDVRHAERVALDDEPVLGALGRLHAAGHAERLLLEVVRQVGVRERREVRRAERVVHLLLVDVVRRDGAGQLVLQGVGGRGGRPLPSGQDVEEQPRVGRQPAFAGRRIRGRRDADGECRGEDEREQTSHGSPCFPGARTVQTPCA